MMGRNLNTTEASGAIYDLVAGHWIAPSIPGATSATNFLRDPKTSPEVKQAARDLLGDTAPDDLLWAAPGSPVRVLNADDVAAVAPQTFRCVPIKTRRDPVELFAAAGTAAVIFTAGWVAGLLTFIAVQ